MWELDYKESWALNNWCFWNVLEKTLENPLDFKEIQPVHPKGNQSWIFIGRTDAETETPILGPPDGKNWLTGKRPWCWERLKVGGEGDNSGWDGWMASLTQWTWVWVDLAVGDGQGGLVSCGSWGHKELDMTEWLNWTEGLKFIISIYNIQLFLHVSYKNYLVSIELLWYLCWRSIDRIYV